MWKKGWRPNHWRSGCQGDLSDHLCHHPHYQESHRHCNRLELFVITLIIKKVITIALGWSSDGALIIFVIILIITKITTIALGWSSPLDRGHLTWGQPVLLRRNSCRQVSFKLSINYHGCDSFNLFGPL